MVPLRIAIDRIEIARRSEDEIFTIGAESRSRRVIPIVGHGIFLSISQIIDIHHTHIVLGRTSVSYPAAVGREFHSIEPRKRLFGNFHLCFCSYIELEQAVFAVAVDYSFPVGTKFKEIYISVGPGG